MAKVHNGEKNCAERFNLLIRSRERYKLSRNVIAGLTEINGTIPSRF